MSPHPTIYIFFWGGEGGRNKHNRELNFNFFLNFASRVGGAAQAQASSLCAWSGSSFSVLLILFKRDAGKNHFAIKLLSLLLFTEASHSPEKARNTFKSWRWSRSNLFSGSGQTFQPQLHNSLCAPRPH